MVPSQRRCFPPVVRAHFYWENYKFSQVDTFRIPASLLVNGASTRAGWVPRLFARRGKPSRLGLAGLLCLMVNHNQPDSSTFCLQPVSTCHNP